MRHSQIKRRLLKRRHELLFRYHAELARADEEVSSRESEDVENATELWDARVLSLLGDADARALARLVAAFRRLEDGSYGRCVECGVGIEAARLAALPETATCIECAQDAEAEHRAPLVAAS
jgi:RNA polymerase-binding transcription factor DksA